MFKKINTIQIKGTGRIDKCDTYLKTTKKAHLFLKHQRNATIDNMTKWVSPCPGLWQAFKHGCL